MRENSLSAHYRLLRIGPSNQSDRTESPAKFSQKREYQLSTRENWRSERPALMDARMRENWVSLKSPPIGGHSARLRREP
jgi:hypothetical protein